MGLLCAAGAGSAQYTLRGGALVETQAARPELGDVRAEERERVLDLWLDTARDLHAGGAHEEAAVYLMHVLAYRPQDEAALALLERVQAAVHETAPPAPEEGEAPEAEGSPMDVVAEPATPARPEEAKLVEANCDVLDGNPALAIPKFQWVIDRDPTMLAAWQGLGWAYWQLGRPEDALALWKKLETLVPESVLAHNLLAKGYIGQGQMEDAAGHLEKSLSLDPAQFETRYAYARVMLWRGRSDAAVPLLESLLKERPDRMDIRIQLARALDADRRYEQSIDLWAQVREAYPEDPNYILGEGLALLRVGDLEGARLRARALLDMEQLEAEALTILADAAEFGSRPQDAEAELQDIVERSDDVRLKLQLLNRLAMLQLRLFNDDPVRHPLRHMLSTVDQALSLDPDSVNFHLLRGEVELKQGHFAAAEDAFQDVLDRYNPRNRRAHYGLFQIHLARKDMDEARAALRRLEEFNPKDPYFHYHRAMMAMGAGEFQEAHKHLDRLEREGARGSVLVLLYHGLAPSEYMPALPTRRFREQMVVLKRAGFRFITPEELPRYLASLAEPPKARPRGFWRRVGMKMREAMSEEDDERPATGDSPLEAYVPEKIVCVTFDDGLRSSFRWGTQIAQDLDLRFGMHIPVGNVLTFDPLISSWEEMRTFAEAGCWSFGSHLVDASTLMPRDAEGYLVRPLANRIWLAGKGRRESHLEYLLRLQREYKLSAQLIHDELRLADQQPSFVAYPMGDLGQEEGSNVDDPISANLLEADLRYGTGFIQSQFGHAVKGDHNLLYQRHEMKRWESGQDIVRFAYLNNPVHLARRLRAEVAAYEGRPHLALRMVEALKRDGCPDDIVDALNRRIEDALGRKADVPAVETEKSPWRVRLSDPFVGIGVTALKDNVETESWEVYGRAGLNLTPQAGLEGRYGVGNYQHEVVTFRTEPTTRVVTRRTESEVTTVTDGNTRNVQETRVTREEIEEFTNVTDRTKFEADVVSVGGQLTLRTSGGPILSVMAMQRSYESDSAGNTIDGESFVALALDYSGKPTLLTEGAIRLEYDAIPTARELVTYYGLGLSGAWDVGDAWEVAGSAIFQDLSDDNTRLFLRGQSMWRVSEAQGIFAGVQGEFANSSEESNEYWTPHWLERLFGRVEMRRRYRDTNFRVGLRYGWGREEPWPDEVDRYEQSKARADVLNFYPGEDPDQGWQPIVGVDLALNRQFASGWQFIVRGSVNEHYDYSGRNLTTELLYRF